MTTILTFEEFNENLKVKESLALDITHVSLDIIGLIPGWGEIADLANTVLYLKNKNYLLAALSVISIIPALGDMLGKSTKFSIYMAKYAKAGTTFSKIVDLAKISSRQIKTIKLLISTNRVIIDNLFNKIMSSDDRRLETVKLYVPNMKEALTVFTRNA
jgi:hypothetical protein